MTRAILVGAMALAIAGCAAKKPIKADGPWVSCVPVSVDAKEGTSTAVCKNVDGHEYQVTVKVVDLKADKVHN